MRPLLSLILTISVAISVPTTTWAQTPKEKWEAYRFIEHIREFNLPFQEFAEKAVLDLETIGVTKTPGEKFEIIDVETVPRETQNKVLSSIKNYIPFQIETCRKQGLRFCPVLKYSNSSTMFFNKGKFYTCRHSFHNWLAIASKANGDRPVDTISPPIILRLVKEGKLKILYNSAYEGKAQLNFSFINADSRLNVQTHGTTYPNIEIKKIIQDVDFVQMEISEPINVEDFNLTERKGPKNSYKIGEETYLLGYPGKTNYFKDGVGDAPGFQLMASSGLTLPPLFPEEYNTSNFGSTGMSGGVVVTANSEILGLHCTGYNEENATQHPERVTSHAFPLDVQFIADFWRTLKYPTVLN